MRTAKRGKRSAITKTGKLVATHVDYRNYKILNELAILEDRSVSSLLRIAIDNFIKSKRATLSNQKNK